MPFRAWSFYHSFVIWFSSFGFHNAGDLMQGDLAAAYAWWTELLLVLAAGTGAIVLAAALASRPLRSAVWQRTIWQAATVGVLGLIALESVGAGTVFVAWFRTLWAPATAAREDAAEVASQQPDASVAELAAGPSATITADSHRPLSALAAETPLWPTRSSEPVDGGMADADPSEAPETLDRSDVVPDSSSFILHPSSFPRIPHPSAWPALLWTFGTLLVLARTAWTRLVLSRVRSRTSQAVGLQTRSRVDRIACQVGLRRRVRVLECGGMSVPVAFGVVRPTVVVPAGFWDRFSREEQEVMLAHELAHLAARDPLWQLVAELACALAWWHPAVWWSRGRLRAASETAADEASLLVPGGPGALAGCLVALGRRMVGPRPLGWLSFQGSGFRSGLGRRVERLLSLKSDARGGPARTGLTAARLVLPVALVVVSVLSTAWARTQASLEEGETMMSVWKSSWRQSLAATVLAACWASASPAPAADDPKAPEHQPAAVHEGDMVLQAQEIRVIEAGRDGQPHVITLQAEPGGQGHAIVVQATAQLDPRAREELDRRRKQLEEGLRDLDARLRALKPDQDRETREVKEKIEVTRRQIEEISKNMGRAGPGAMGPEVRELMTKRLNLEQKARDIEGKLKERPDSPEARELREALEKTHREIAEITERLPPQMRGIKIAFGEKGRVMVFGGMGGGGMGGMAIGVGGPPIPPEERDQLQRRLGELDAKIRERKEAGKHEEAGQLLQEAQEIKRRLAGPPAGMMGFGGAGGGFGGGFSGGGGGFGAVGGFGGGAPMPQLDPAERERRMKHLKIAVENLHAAGMHEQAERLLREGEAMLQGRPMGGMIFGPAPAGTPGMPGMAPGGAPMGTQGIPPHAPGMPGQPPPGTPMMPGMALPPGASAPAPGPVGPPMGMPPGMGGGMTRPVAPSPPGQAISPGQLQQLQEQIQALQRQMEELRQQLRTRDQPRPRDEARPREKGETRQTREQPQPREEPRR
jgi:uncharacterized membrane protein YgcG